jgi:hypothetical protein
MKTQNEIKFDQDDIDILNEVLDLIPELKISALAVKLQREKQCQCCYPINDHNALFDLFEGEEILVKYHRINLKLIQRYVQPSLFPIANDKELAQAVYLALASCNTDMNWALQAPPYADELLAEAKKELLSFPKISGELKCQV